MTSLTIIITGQIRKFFIEDISTSFIQLIKKSHIKYSFIYVICIINESTELDIINLTNFFNSLSVSFIIEEYQKYISIFKKINLERLENDGFKRMANIYNKVNGSIQKIMTPTNHTMYPSINGPFGFHTQWHQLEIGIKFLLDYEGKNNIKFDTCMRLRFDTCIIDPEFYPHIPNTDLISKITFNNTIFLQLNEKMKELKINTIEEYIEFMKNNQIKVPNYLSDYPHTSFGCYFFNNYISLENIVNSNKKNTDDNILYCFIDHIIFGKRDIFIKLQNFFRDFGKFESELNQNGMQAFFGSENQLCLFCFNNNINPLMYTSHSVFELKSSNYINHLKNQNLLIKKNQHLLRYRR